MTKANKLKEVLEKRSGRSVVTSYSQYRLLFGDAKLLEEQVNEFIAKGWRPQGSPAVITIEDMSTEFNPTVFLVQAIVK